MALGYALVYSPELVNSNVHSLLHVLEDVEKFGDLGTISAYDFEARLHDIRQLVRTGRYSLAQAVNRIFELQRVEANRLKQVVPNTRPTVRSVGRYTEAVIRKGFILRDNFRDQWFLTKDGHVILYHDAKMVGEELHVKGHQITHQESTFTSPCPSEEINVCTVHMRNISTYTIIGPSSAILCKLAAVEGSTPSEYVVVPLTHTYPSV